MAKLNHCLWLFAALVCLAGGASAAEAAAPRAEPAPEKEQLRIEVAPTPAPAAKAPEAKTPADPAAPAAAAAKPAPKPQGIVEFTQAPASEVLAFVAEYAGVNIITDPDCAEKLKTQLSFRAKGMTCRQVLDWATRLSGTAWIITNGAVYVTSREKLPKQEPLVELVQKVILDNPALFQEPAKFEPAPEMALPVNKK